MGERAMDDSVLREEFAQKQADSRGTSTQQFISSSGVRAIMWDKSGGHCWYCGRVMNPWRNFCIDHMVARKRGGDESYDNLVPACRQCNMSKGPKSLEEFRQTMTLRLNNVPKFTDTQLGWLEAAGVVLPDLQPLPFYFEEMLADG